MPGCIVLPQTLLRYLNRKRLRQIIRFDGAEAIDASLATTGPEDQTETRVLVQQALARINPKDAAILQLHFGNSFSYEEIGHIFKMSSEAVRKRVERGVEKFRMVYEETMPVTPARNVASQFIGVRRNGK